MMEKMEKKTTPKYAWVVTGVMVLAWFCCGLGLSAVIPWIPYYLANWGINFIQAGVLLTVTAVPLMFIGPLTGWMAKKIGKMYAKWIVTISLTIMFLSAIGCALAPEFWTLLIARFFMGIGIFGIFLTGVMAVIPWFGMQNIGNLMPKFSVIGIVALSMAFALVLTIWGSLNAGLFAQNYVTTQLATFVPIFGISALLAAGLIKGAK
jgi:MFS family permease